LGDARRAEFKKEMIAVAPRTSCPTLSTSTSIISRSFLAEPSARTSLAAVPFLFLTYNSAERSSGPAYSAGDHSLAEVCLFALVS
jgi:hypothetical protein